jgi:hypothetical protein
MISHRWKASLKRLTCLLWTETAVPVNWVNIDLKRSRVLRSPWIKLKVDLKLVVNLNWAENWFRGVQRLSKWQTTKLIHFLCEYMMAKRCLVCGFVVWIQFEVVGIVTLGFSKSYSDLFIVIERNLNLFCDHECGLWVWELWHHGSCEFGDFSGIRLTGLDGDK